MKAPIDNAISEGLRVFWAHMHVGHSSTFVGDCWEAGGFQVNEAGEPVLDCRFNTVAKFHVEDLDHSDRNHRALCAEWWGG